MSAKSSGAVPATLGLFEKARLSGRVECVSRNFGPERINHSESQLPLKPVCPVRNTRRPFQNERLSVLAYSFHLNGFINLAQYALVVGLQNQTPYA